MIQYIRKVEKISSTHNPPNKNPNNSQNNDTFKKMLEHANKNNSDGFSKKLVKK